MGSGSTTPARRDRSVSSDFAGGGAGFRKDTPARRDRSVSSDFAGAAQVSGGIRRLVATGPYPATSPGRRRFPEGYAGSSRPVRIQRLRRGGAGFRRDTPARRDRSVSSDFAGAAQVSGGIRRLVATGPYPATSPGRRRFPEGYAGSSRPVRIQRLRRGGAGFRRDTPARRDRSVSSDFAGAAQVSGGIRRLVATGPYPATSPGRRRFPEGYAGSSRPARIQRLRRGGAGFR